jgi:hypothetical protein
MGFKGYMDKFYMQYRICPGRLKIGLKSSFCYCRKVPNLANSPFPLNTKMQLLCLILQNPRIEDKKVRIEAKKPFNLILDSVDCKSWLPEQDALRTFALDALQMLRIQSIIYCNLF